VLKDIHKNGVIVVSRGSRAIGKVANLKKSKILGVSVKVGLTINSVVATNGQKINLVFSKQKNAKNAVGKTLILGLAATPLFFLKGNEASVSAGQEFDVQVSSNQVLDY